MPRKRRAHRTGSSFRAAAHRQRQRGPVPPPLLPPLDEPDSSRIELEVPPQAASSTVMVIPAMIDNLRMSQHPSPANGLRSQLMTADD